MPVTIIAEAGVNHNGDLETAKRMAYVAKECGADIVKVAMMPRTKADVFNLLEVTEDMSNKLKTPVITMSMGKLGAISRLCGEFSSSAVTFATVGKCSAPGQMPVDKVKECLELIHNQMR